MKNSLKKLLTIIPCLYSSSKICILEKKPFKVRLFYVILFWLIQGIFAFTLYPIFGIFIFGEILELFNDSVFLGFIITPLVLWILFYIILIPFAYLSPLVEIKNGKTSD